MQLCIHLVYENIPSWQASMLSDKCFRKEDWRGTSSRSETQWWDKLGSKTLTFVGYRPSFLLLSKCHLKIPCKSSENNVNENDAAPWKQHRRMKSSIANRTAFYSCALGGSDEQKDKFLLWALAQVEYSYRITLSYSYSSRQLVITVYNVYILHIYSYIYIYILYTLKYMKYILYSSRTLKGCTK